MGGGRDCEHDFSISIESRRERNERDIKDRNSKEATKSASAFNSKNTNFCSRCGAWKGQLGLEPTFYLYLEHLCEIFDEIKRVLKKDGTCWVNLGDTYASSPAGNKEIKFTGDGVYGRLMQRHSQGDKLEMTPKPKSYGVPNKSLCCIPDRFKIEMINRGWTLRNTIIWYKRNVMPSSVKDRFTVDFEYVFFFVKDKKYFFEKQYSQLAQSSFKDKRLDKGRQEHKGKSSTNQYSTSATVINSKGKNMRCVWDITTHSYKEAHFATFPENLVVPMIKAGCPEFVCNKCGKPREPIFEPSEEYKKILERNKKNGANSKDGFPRKDSTIIEGKKLEITQSNIKLDKTLSADYKIEGYSDCGCNAGFSPGIVLDPFAGSGTTLKVARDLNRNSIGIEIKEEYYKLIEKRLFHGNAPLIKEEFELITDTD